jgi:hypothetical protein
MKPNFNLNKRRREEAKKKKKEEKRMKRLAQKTEAATQSEVLPPDLPASDGIVN